jgi:hypothetical protein
LYSSAASAIAVAASGAWMRPTYFGDEQAIRVMIEGQRKTMKTL